ncbi:MAG: hypothetical protein ACT6Q8_05470 [Niveispirillum sp.]
MVGDIAMERIGKYHAISANIAAKAGVFRVLVCETKNSTQLICLFVG